MSIKQLLAREKEIPRIDLIIIISHVLSQPKERVMAETDRMLTEEEKDRIEALLEERRRGKPLAYLTNLKEFFSEEFYVDERVLIPRPETELIVEEALEIARQRKGCIRVLDMGAGSGVIGILLAKAGADQVFCVDKSPGALAVAKRNAEKHRVGERVALVAADLFQALKKGPIFDIVCANLPYVSEEEWDELAVDVKEFEPKEALLGGKQGTEVYERFLAEARGCLKPGAIVLCEMGSKGQTDSLTEGLKKSGFDVAVIKDLAGRQRVVRASWTNS